MNGANYNTRAGTVIKAGIWYTIASFLTKGVAFFTTPVFARLLSSDEFGEYSNFVAWTGIITIVATMEMHATVNRARYDYEDIDKYLSSIAILGTITTSLLWGAVHMFPDFSSNLFSMDMKYIDIMFMSAMVSPALQLFQAKNRIVYDYKAFVAISFGSVLLSTAVSVILVLLLQNKLAGRIFGQYGTTIFIDFLVYLYLICKGKNFDLNECKYALGICLPMILHLLSKYVLNQSDRIMIKQFCGASDTAFYSLAYSCAMIPVMLGNALNIAWSPWAGEKLYRGEFETIRKGAFFYISFFLCVVIGIFLLGPEIIYVLGGEMYAQSVNVLPPVVLGAAFLFLCNLYVGLEQFAKQTRGMALGTSVAVTVNIILNWAFIPQYGYVAAAYTTLVGYGCLLVIHYFLARRTGYIRSYDTKFVVGALAILSLMMPMILALYKVNPLVRYFLSGGFIAILSLIVYKRRNGIAAIIKK